MQPDAASAAAGSAGSSEPALSDSKASGGNIAEQAEQRADAHLSMKPVAGEGGAALEAALAAVKDTDALPAVDVGTGTSIAQRHCRLSAPSTRCSGGPRGHI